MIKIACVGDNVVDINYIDGIVNPGGNCVNVAVYCSQMRHKAAYVGVLADDDYAKVITDSLKKNQVAYDMSPVGHGETGRCFINLVDGDRIIGDENDGGLLKASPLRLDEKLIMYLKKFDIVHTSCYSYIDDELEKIKDAGIPLLYDFSIEWDDEKISRLSEVADFALFSGRDDKTEEENMSVLKKVVDGRHCRMAILTMGTQGAWVYDGHTVHTKKPYNIEGGAIDTTGCGDSWISGFISTYIEITKRMYQMATVSDEHFIQQKNVEDVKTHAIEMAMCMGNLKARQTCRIKGAYGCGVPVDSIRKRD